MPHWSHSCPAPDAHGASTSEPHSTLMNHAGGGGGGALQKLPKQLISTPTANFLPEACDDPSRGNQHTTHHGSQTSRKLNVKHTSPKRVLPTNGRQMRLNNAYGNRNIAPIPTSTPRCCWLKSPLCLCPISFSPMLFCCHTPSKTRQCYCRVIPRLSCCPRMFRSRVCCLSRPGFSNYSWPLVLGSAGAEHGLLCQACKGCCR